MNDREERIGRNEILFREVNERIEALQRSFAGESERAEFICECGNADCAQHISMTLAEYERVRADPTAFAVVPGHEMASVERVVERRGSFDVVRKRAGEAAELAAEESPR
jgi:hypothetical protein